MGNPFLVNWFISVHMWVISQMSSITFPQFSDGMGCNVILYLSSKTFVSLGALVLVIHLIKICYDLISVSLPHIFCYSVVTRLSVYIRILIGCILMM